MPEISRFYGMIVKMFFQQREHNPPQHQAELLTIWNTQNFMKLPPLE